MSLKLPAALCLGLVLSSLAAIPADAQTRQRAVDGTRITTKDEDGRVRTRVVIERRSFLDPGTEILPGSQPSTNNVWPYGYTPLGIIEGTNFGGIRYPLPGPYSLPGRDNPFVFP